MILPSEMTQRCTRCGQVKGMLEFSPCSRLLPGRKTKNAIYCRKCAAEVRMIRYHRNVEMSRHTCTEYRRRKNAENPQQMKAWNRRRSQDVGDTGRCRICGATENLQLHHKDYTKPFEVLTYCARHHKRLHDIIARMKKLGRMF